MTTANSFTTALKQNLFTGSLNNTIYFFKKHFMVIMGLGLIAAFGRVIQLGGFGQVSSAVNIILEVVIESARIVLVFYVLGLASLKNGLSRVKHFFAQKHSRKQMWYAAIEKLKKQWGAILINFVGFLLISGIMNYLIDQLAYETCLYISLKQGGILSATSSEWTILLFFKNLSVIPFTLVFETMLLLWLADRSTRVMDSN